MEGGDQPHVDADTTTGLAWPMHTTTAMPMCACYDAERTAAALLRTDCKKVCSCMNVSRHLTRDLAVLGVQGEPLIYPADVMRMSPHAVGAAPASTV